jgi:hypothetical protein
MSRSVGTGRPRWRPDSAVILNVRTTGVVRVDVESHVGRLIARGPWNGARNGQRRLRRSGTFPLETGRLTSAICCSASVGGSEVLL